MHKEDVHSEVSSNLPGSNPSYAAGKYQREKESLSLQRSLMRKHNLLLILTGFLSGAIVTSAIFILIYFNGINDSDLPPALDSNTRTVGQYGIWYSSEGNILFEGGWVNGEKRGCHVRYGRDGQITEIELWQENDLILTANWRLDSGDLDTISYPIEVNGEKLKRMIYFEIPQEGNVGDNTVYVDRSELIRTSGPSRDN